MLEGLWAITDEGWSAYLRTEAMLLQGGIPFDKADLAKGIATQAQALNVTMGMKLSDDMLSDDDDGSPSVYTLEGAYKYATEIVDNVGILNINGTLVSDYVYYNRWLDRISYPEIIAACDYLEAKFETGQITKVIMRVNTPGGAVHGIETASSRLEALGKKMPLMAHAETQMTSGGVWLSVSAKRITANRMAVVGSLGVIAVHMSYARMLDQAGIDATVMRSGSEKALGSPYEKLDAKAKEIRQESMDLVHEEFRNRVQLGRGLSRDQVLAISTGRSWMAFQPEANSLVDEVLPFEQVVAKQTAVHNPRNSAQGLRYAAIQITEKGTGSMKIKVLNDKGVAALQAGASKEDLFADASMYDIVDAAEVTDASVTEADGKPQGDAKDKDDEEDEDKKPEDDEEEDDKKKVVDTKPVDAALVTELRTENRELNRANAKLELKVEAANAKVTDIEAQMSSQANYIKQLEGIALSAIQRMEVPLNATASDDGLKGTALIERHTAMTDKFNARFKVGAQARQSVTSNDNSAASDLDELNRRLGK